MAPRRSNPRSTQRVKLEISPDHSSASPDPIALTPAPRLRRTRASESSPPSTQAPSSELRTGSGTRKTRLRSGRRSKGVAIEDVLGEGDLVVPSDEDEYEAWVDEKSKDQDQDRASGNGKAESSKMAQERYAKFEQVCHCI